ncbi:SH3 domain-containing protein [Micrococcaceae bacterium RIT802]|nr:SH3 domain-containing protein [Micrococcaceae bacterium RIT 802]
MNKTKKLLWSTLSAVALIAGTIGAGPVYAAPAKDTVVSPLKPNTYRFSSTQGPRCIPVRNGTTSHLGQDLPASNGSPIYAVANGVVTATHNGVYGGTAGYIIVRHILGGQTYYTAYIHMYNAGKYVRAGQSVKAGQRIADVGSSGASTAPHLHFEVWGSAGWMKGPTIEPMAWLKRYGVDMRRHATTVYNFTLPKSCSYWAASDLNLRASSSSSSKLVKLVRKGTPMTSVPGAYANGYVRVTAGGTNGWALHGAISPTRVAANTQTIDVKPVAAGLYYYATANVNYRQGPSTGYAVLGTVPKGGQVKVTGTSSGWMRVTYGSKTGFISSTYLSRTRPAAPPVKAPAKTPAKPAPKPAVKPSTPAKSVAKQVKSNVNLRKGASTKHAVVLVLPKGATVVQSSATAGWSKVTYKGRTGYVSSSYLTAPAKAPAKPKPVVKAPAKAPVKKAPAKTVTRQTSAKLSLRKATSTSSARLLVIPKNAKVAVTSTSKGWSKVTYKGKTGYVSATYLKAVPAAKPAVKKPVSKPKPVVKAPAKVVKKVTKQTKANLNLRSGASTKHKSLLVVPRNAKVSVASTSKGWSKVTYQGKTGYVSASYLKNVAAAKPAVKKPVVKKAAAKAPAKKSVKKTTKKTTANLSLRAGASTSKKRVLVIPKNAKVTVASTSKGWSKVTYQGKTGYASAKYLK